MEKKLTEKINELGMIVIPYTIRKELEINYKDKMETYIENENIILKKITNKTETNENKIIRVVDELGRIIIPFETRKALNIYNGDELEIFVRENAVILKSA